MSKYFMEKHHCSIGHWDMLYCAVHKTTMTRKMNQRYLVLAKNLLPDMQKNLPPPLLLLLLTIPPPPLLLLFTVPPA